MAITEYLVVAATAAEAAYVPEGLRVVVTGLGKTPAAVGTVRALATYDDPTTVAVVNIGTAGALHDGMEGLHLPGAVLNHDINADAVRALGYDPHERIDLGGDGVVLASGDTFVTDPAVRARLAERADLVDMEGYGVAYAARELGAACRLVKHVSDNADEGALDWPALVDASARELGAWVREHLVRTGSAPP